MLIIMIAVLIIFSLAAFFIYNKLSKAQPKSDKAFVLAAASFLILAIGLELSIFNVNFYSTFENLEAPLNYYLEEVKLPDGSFSVPAGETIQFPELNAEIENIKIDLSNKNAGSVDVEVLLTDEANEFYFSAGERQLFTFVEKSQYLNIHSSGKTNHLALVFDSDTEEISLDGISINANRPFEFSFLRLLIVFGALCLIYIFKPSSVLYKKKLIEAQSLKSSLMMAFLCLQCGLIIVLGSINPTFMGIATEGYNSYKWDGSGIDFTELSMKHHNQYDELAQAILNGKTYIDNDDVPESLKNLENPYDTALRSAASAESGDSYRWDVAYFDGHYYVYFGIVPLLIMYLPFRALFGTPFPSAVGIMIFAFIFAVGVFKLLDLLCQKKFKSISVGAFLLTALSFINCCGAMFLVKRPDFYSVPIITSMAFVIWGIYLWLKGLWNEKSNNLQFLLGSLFMALSVGCRPQSVLICGIALPLFLGYFFKDNFIFKKEGIKKLILLGAPFIIVASGIMYYNFIRFGSPFDFGSSYNLTTNDVTRRGFELGRTFFGIFTYLFQTPQLTGEFPYLQAVEIETAYLGKTIHENCFGGLITSLPMLWFIFALPKAKEGLKEKKLFALSLTLLFIGLALVVADTQAGGLLQRYFSDFGYIFFLLAVIVIFALYDSDKLENNAKSLNALIIFSAFLSIFYSFALAFSVSDVTIDTQNPTLFGTIRHLVEFWI